MDIKYYKILNKTMNHDGFQYHLGLNIDTDCGLCYTTKENLHKYFHDGNLLAEIKIPDDAKVILEGDKWRADKINILRITPLQESKIGKKLLQTVLPPTNYKILKKYKRFKCQRTNDDGIHICNRRADKCDSCGIRICDKCRKEYNCCSNKLT